MYFDQPTHDEKHHHLLAFKVCKVVHLQVVVVVKAVWSIFNNTNGLYLQVNTLLFINKLILYLVFTSHGTIAYICLVGRLRVIL